MHQEARDLRDKKDDHRAGVIAAMVGNSGFSRGTWEPADFFPSLRSEEERAPDPEGLRALFVGWAQAHNARLAKTEASMEEDA